MQEGRQQTQAATPPRQRLGAGRAGGRCAPESRRPCAYSHTAGTGGRQHPGGGARDSERFSSKRCLAVGVSGGPSAPAAGVGCSYQCLMDGIAEPWCPTSTSPSCTHLPHGPPDPGGPAGIGKVPPSDGTPRHALQVADGSSGPPAQPAALAAAGTLLLLLLAVMLLLPPAPGSRLFKAAGGVEQHQPPAWAKQRIQCGSNWPNALWWQGRWACCRPKHARLCGGSQVCT